MSWKISDPTILYEHPSIQDDFHSSVGLRSSSHNPPTRILHLENFPAKKEKTNLQTCPSTDRTAAFAQTFSRLMRISAHRFCWLFRSRCSLKNLATYLEFCGSSRSRMCFRNDMAAINMTHRRGRCVPSNKYPFCLCIFCGLLVFGRSN